MKALAIPLRFGGGADQPVKVARSNCQPLTRRFIIQAGQVFHEVMLPAACMPKFTSAMETNQFCPNCQKELEVVVKLQEYKEVKPVTVEERTKELKRYLKYL